MPGARALTWVLAPSTSLLGRLRYAQKFVLVGLVLIVPLALVAGAYNQLERRQIDLGTRERQGVAYIRPLGSLTAALVAARHQVARGRVGPSPEAAGLATALAVMDTTDQRMGGVLGLRSAWTSTRALVEAARSGQGLANQMVARYDTAVDALLALIVDVGDASGLTLDPDLDTYYLMDTVLFLLPKLIDTVGRVSDVVALAPTSPDVHLELGIARGALPTTYAALTHNLGTVAAATRRGDIRQLVASDAEQLEAALLDCSQSVNTAVRTGNAGHLDVRTIERLQRVAAVVTDHSLESLDLLLESRIDQLTAESRWVVAGTVGAALVALYLFGGFYVSVVVSIRRIVTSLRAVAAGDLTQRVRVDTRDELRYVAEVLNDTVARTRDATELLTEQATLDALTGLPNRVVVLQRLERARATGRSAWVLFIDLDRFKAVNDSCGHEAGDEVLCEVARRIRDVAPGRAEAGRLAGDEFVLVVGGDGDEAEARRLGGLVVQRMAERIRLSSGRYVGIGASIGIAAVTEDADPEELLRRADVAMYAAKRAGRGRVEVYDRALASGVEERQRTRTELRDALEADGLTVHYQPIVDVAAGRPAGFEALARWEHPDRGLLLPHHFVDVAEESSLILPLGRAVLAVACRQLVSWQAAYPQAAEAYVSVNVSPAQLAAPDFVAVVARVLAETGLSPRSLILEITESSIMADTERTRLALEGLGRLGVRVAVDDFGVGYSSLAYLSRFPVQGLKLDRSFVAGMLQDHYDAAIVSMLVRLGADLGLAVVAEGVETVDQRDHLLGLGCSTMQGYLFGRPVPADRAWPVGDPGPAHLPVQGGADRSAVAAPVPPVP